MSLLRGFSDLAWANFGTTAMLSATVLLLGLSAAGLGSTGVVAGLGYGMSWLTWGSRLMNGLSVAKSVWCGKFGEAFHKTSRYFGLELLGSGGYFVQSYLPFLKNTNQLSLIPRFLINTGVQGFARLGQVSLMRKVFSVASETVLRSKEDASSPYLKQLQQERFQENLDGSMDVSTWGMAMLWGAFDATLLAFGGEAMPSGFIEETYSVKKDESTKARNLFESEDLPSYPLIEQNYAPEIANEQSVLKNQTTALDLYYDYSLTEHGGPMRAAQYCNLVYVDAFDEHQMVPSPNSTRLTDMVRNSTYGVLDRYDDAVTDQLTSFRTYLNTFDSAISDQCMVSAQVVSDELDAFITRFEEIKTDCDNNRADCSADQSAIIQAFIDKIKAVKAEAVAVFPNTVVSNAENLNAIYRLLETTSSTVFSQLSEYAGTVYSTVDSFISSAVSDIESVRQAVDTSTVRADWIEGSADNVVTQSLGASVEISTAVDSAYSSLATSLGSVLNSSEATYNNLIVRRNVLDQELRGFSTEVSDSEFVKYTDNLWFTIPVTFLPISLSLLYKAYQYSFNISQSLGLCARRCGCNSGFRKDYSKKMASSNPYVFGMRTPLPGPLGSNTHNRFEQMIKAINRKLGRLFTENEMQIKEVMPGARVDGSAV